MVSTGANTPQIIHPKSQVNTNKSPLICGNCSQCCQGPDRELLLEEDEGMSDDYPYYVKSGRRYLMRKSNGDCIFFDGGCTIYSDRPMACRLFDCRDYVNHPDLPERVRVEALKRV